MAHASIDYLAGGTANSTSTVGDPLLREDWPASSRGAAKRAEALRCQCALPLGNHPTCASAGVFVERDPAFVLWFPQRHSPVGALANSLSKKTCRVGSPDGWNQSSARCAQETDDE